MAALAIEEIEVGHNRVEARVRVLDPALLRTSSERGLSKSARELLPGLARHSCENSEARDFLTELRDTETPHLLEHVAAELMALSGSPRSLKGETVWDFARDGRGVFSVRLEYDDDLVAVGALREALAIVEWLLAPAGATRPDVSEATERLRALRA
jgi:hypothetical protein